MKHKLPEMPKDLEKPNLTRYQENQKVKEAKIPTMMEKLKKNPEKPKLPNKGKKSEKLKNPRYRKCRKAKNSKIP